MPKYLKAVAMKTEKSTAEHTLMWLILPKYINCHRERSGSVVECLTRDRGPQFRASPTSQRCGPWARHIYPSLVLFKPRKTRPCLTEILLMGRKESNQTKHKLSLFSYKIQDHVWNTSMRDCCMIKRIRGSYLPHPLLMQDKYIVTI